MVLAKESLTPVDTDEQISSGRPESGRVPTEPPENGPTIVATWLDRRVDPLGFFIMAWAIVAMALLSLAYWTDFYGIAAQIAPTYSSVFIKSEWWRLFSGVLIHVDPRHLLANSLLFFILGSFLAGHFGLLRVSAAALISGALINLIVLPTMDADTSVIGASGVVFWMGGSWLSLYVLLDRRRSIIHRLLRAIGVGLLLFMPSEAFDPAISYRSHAVGFALGMAMGTFHFLMNRSSFRAAEVISFESSTESEN